MHRFYVDMNLGNIIQPSIPGVTTSQICPLLSPILGNSGPRVWWSCLTPPSTDSVSISLTSAYPLSQIPCAPSLLPSQRYKVAS